MVKTILLPLQQIVNPRRHSDVYYNVGAHVLTSTPAKPYEEASLHVTTTEDIIDIYDGKISLREPCITLLTVYSLLILICWYDYITFDDSLFTGGQSTITLSDTYQELRITNALTNKELSMNAQYNNAGTQVAQNVTVKVSDPATNYRIFQAGNRYEYNTNWDISWTNMTIQGGSIDTDAQRNQYGHGGAIYVRGNNANLEFNIVEVSDSTASGSGGGLYVSTNNDKEIDFHGKGGSITITMQDVRFDNNKLHSRWWNL